MRDDSQRDLDGLDALAREVWEHPAHEQRLGAKLAASRADEGRSMPRRALVAGIAVVLAAGAGVAGASAVPGIRALFEKGADGETEMVLTDQDGKELHRRRPNEAGFVIQIDGKPGCKPASHREERRGR